MGSTGRSRGPRVSFEDGVEGGNVGARDGPGSGEVTRAACTGLITIEEVVSISIYSDVADIRSMLMLLSPCLSAILTGLSKLLRSLADFRVVGVAVSGSCSTYFSFFLRLRARLFPTPSEKSSLQ
jgi:hypothetical protein